MSTARSGKRFVSPELPIQNKQLPMTPTPTYFQLDHARRRAQQLGERVYLVGTIQGTLTGFEIVPQSQLANHHALTSLPAAGQIAGMVTPDGTYRPNGR